MSLPGQDLLAQIENDHPKLGMYLRNYLIPAIEQSAGNAAVSPHGKIAAPAPPESVTATPATVGDMMQVTVNHTAPVQKGVHYIYSIANNPQMSGAMIEAKPATRAPVHFPLPTYNSGGDTKHKWYVAVQTQYPGSDPSAATYHGGAAPASVTLNGTAAADVQPGSGSGTATNGGQKVVGLGKAQIRT